MELFVKTEDGFDWDKAIGAKEKDIFGHFLKNPTENQTVSFDPSAADCPVLGEVPCQVQWTNGSA